MSAYVDPAVRQSTQDVLSTIVTADSSQHAAKLVEQVGGRVTSDLWLIDAVGALLSPHQVEALAAMPGVRSIVENKRVMQSDWGDGGSSYSLTTDLAWPVAIDVGADQVHAAGVTGKGVTVMVVDSGVFFSPLMSMFLGADVAIPFAGQMDFLGDGVCPEGNSYQVYLMKQYDGYCMQYFSASVDRYGHGTHVAGIIGNNYKDAATNVSLGIAPGAWILSARSLGADGTGNYIDTIEAIQAGVAQKDERNIRVINLSLSAYATVPYFVDPLNRAVEAAWAAGIVVVAAAGNEGPNAETITVPGSDPYVITVGALDTNRTPGDWSDDILPRWSATGPTPDGFLKPDVLAPGSKIVSFMYNNPSDPLNTAMLALQHPDYSETTELFRMSGTSMATAVTSGVVALMLEAHPELTPDQVKFRLKYAAKPAVDGDDIAYNLLQQGAGRIWAPDAVFGTFPADGVANTWMDINADLAHGYATEADLAYHYQGPIRKMLSDDGSTVLYYAMTADGVTYGFGAADANGLSWFDLATLTSRLPTWSGGMLTMISGMEWAGGYSNPAGLPTWSGRLPTWSGGMDWAGGMEWAGGLPTWSGG
ncbi:MAG: hypothetical protein D6790_20000, partial [Caldilineae bacterium]